MDDRLNATANVCLSSVYARTICHNERKRVAVRPYGREHELLNDALAKNFCHILRKRMGVLWAHHQWQVRALRLLKFLLLDLSLALAQVYNVLMMWPVNRPHLPNLE